MDLHYCSSRIEIRQERDSSRISPERRKDDHLRGIDDGNWQLDNRVSGRWEGGIRLQDQRNLATVIWAVRFCKVDIPYIPTQWHDTFMKALWDTGAEKSFVSAEVNKSYFFRPNLSSDTAIITA
ncbi:hypothetical protein TNCV_3685381 [Trichonephila clavipes]|nr:hypothetical protein TNCV_3685381 [Trichonephila clavipes]